MRSKKCRRHRLYHAHGRHHQTRSDPEAKDLIGQPISIPAQVPEKPKPETFDAKAIYAASLETMKKHAAAKAYCDGRGLKYHDFLGIGYKSQKTKDKWARGCIIFPLRDAAGKTVSLYGRAIKGSGHYYTAGRKGLYPYYPDATTKTLILTESVIDAAQPPALRVRAGPVRHPRPLRHERTNGRAQSGHHQAQRPGRDHSGPGQRHRRHQSHGRNRRRTNATETGTYDQLLALPEGGDVNEVASGAEDVVATFNDLFARREIIANAAPVVPSDVPTSSLNTDNRNNLIYQSHTATYEVKGGVRTAPKDLDSLKVTLCHPERRRQTQRPKTRPLRRQTNQPLRPRRNRAIGPSGRLDRAGLGPINGAFRKPSRSHPTEVKREETSKIMINDNDRKRCLEFLKGPNLLARINELIEQAGITGEENNRLLLFVVASSFAMPNTLHALIQGASGAVKLGYCGWCRS